MTVVRGAVMWTCTAALIGLAWYGAGRFLGSTEPLASVVWFGFSVLYVAGSLLGFWLIGGRGSQQ